MVTDILRREKHSEGERVEEISGRQKALIESGLRFGFAFGLGLGLRLGSGSGSGLGLGSGSELGSG